MKGVLDFKVKNTVHQVLWYHMQSLREGIEPCYREYDDETANLLLLLPFRPTLLLIYEFSGYLFTESILWALNLEGSGCYAIYGRQSGLEV